VAKNGGSLFSGCREEWCLAGYLFPFEGKFDEGKGKNRKAGFSKQVKETLLIFSLEEREIRENS